MRRALERVEIPGEHEVRERAWRVSAAAFAERQPAPQRGRRRLAPAIGVVVVGAVAAAAFSAPGRALLRSIRETVGVQGAQPALFSLPAAGQLLVHSNGGVWVVQADGSKRRLGSYTSASWSPHGLYIVATRRNALYAVTPTGDERWSLGRPQVRSPRWTGTRADSRIAYLDRSGLRIVAGDGTADRLLTARVEDVAPAWQPGARHALAYADSKTSLVVVDSDTGQPLWRARSVPRVEQLAWSPDGRLLLVRGRRSLVVFRPDGVRLHDLLGPGAAAVTSAAFSPDGTAVAFVQHVAGRSDLWVVPRLRPHGSAARRVFSGAGRFANVAWSPDGRWLLLAWKDADQWLFIRSAGVRRLDAVSNISSQFRAQGFPRVEGWCCAQP